MRQFYALNIQNNYVTVLFVKKTRKLFTIADYQVIDISELTEFLKNKKNYYISIEQDEVVDDKVSIQSVIKNDDVIRNLIIRKLHEATSGKKIIFNYHPLPQNLNDEKTTYQIDGVFEKEYLDSLKLIDDWGTVKSSTTNKFSLLGISKECIKKESYFSIHTHADKITILAIHKGALIFSRLNTIMANNAETRKMNMVDEITQTITYVQQQFRDIKFSAIALSGSIAIDDIIPEHIYMSSGIATTVLYPNTFIRGFTDEEPQHYIFSIGSWFIPKEFQFLPTTMLALRQYNSSSQLLLVASLITVLIISFFTFEKYDSYTDTLNNYDTIKSKLIRIAHNTDTYSEDDLKKNLKHLQIAQKHQQYHPSDILWSLKPFIELQKPEDAQWQYTQDSLALKTTFKKSFSTLEELYQFEKIFYREFKDINSTLKKSYSTKTDYAEMVFDTVLSIQSESQAAPEQSNRRRRR